MRVGNGKRPADNLAQGAIVVPIDLATGMGKRKRLVDGFLGGRSPSINRKPCHRQPG